MLKAVLLLKIIEKNVSRGSTFIHRKGNIFLFIQKCVNCSKPFNRLTTLKSILSGYQAIECEQCKQNIILDLAAA